jgi:predicted dehydrogenase
VKTTDSERVITARKAVNMKVGIIGSGSIARIAHAPGYNELDGVELVACSDVDGDRASKFAKEFDIPQSYDTYAEMLDKHDLDIVSVCTPNYAHREAAVAALQSGVNVLCEKPLAVTVEDAEAIVTAAKEAGKLLMVGQHMRFSQNAQTAKRWIDGNRVGDAYYATANWLRRAGIPGWGQFHIKEKSGGGPMIDIGVHVIDLVFWLMGAPKPVAVSAMTARQFGDRTDVISSKWNFQWDRSEFDVEDLAAGIVRMDNGSMLQFEVSWAAHTKHEMWGGKVLGSQGGITIEGEDVTLYTQLDDTLVNVTPDHGEAKEPHFAEIEHFVECVRDGKEPLVKPEESLNVIKILETAYKSAEAGHELEI